MVAASSRERSALERDEGTPSSSSRMRASSKPRRAAPSLTAEASWNRGHETFRRRGLLSTAALARRRRFGLLRWRRSPSGQGHKLTCAGRPAHNVVRIAPAPFSLERGGQQGQDVCPGGARRDDGHLPGGGADPALRLDQLERPGQVAVRGGDRRHAHRRIAGVVSCRSEAHEPRALPHQRHRQHNAVRTNDVSSCCHGRRAAGTTELLPGGSECRGQLPDLCCRFCAGIAAGLCRRGHSGCCPGQLRGPAAAAGTCRTAPPHRVCTLVHGV